MSSKVPESLFYQMVGQYKRWVIEEALRGCGGNVTQAAKRLGLTRQNLQWMIRRFGVKKEREGGKS